MNDWANSTQPLDINMSLSNSPDQRCPLVIFPGNRPLCYSDTDSDMACIGSIGQDPPWSQVAHQLPIPGFTTLESSPAILLFIVPISLFLFCFHCSTIYLLFLVVPGVSECLRVISGRVSGVLCPTPYYGARQGSSQASSLS